MLTSPEWLNVADHPSAERSNRPEPAFQCWNHKQFSTVSTVGESAELLQWAIVNYCSELFQWATAGRYCELLQWAIVRYCNEEQGAIVVSYNCYCEVLQWGGEGARRTGADWAQEPSLLLQLHNAARATFYFSFPVAFNKCTLNYLFHELSLPHQAVLDRLQAHISAPSHPPHIRYYPLPVPLVPPLP